MKASELAVLVGGRFEGETDPEITGVAAIDRAASHELSFVAHPKYAAYLPQARAGALLVTDALVGGSDTELPRIIVKDVHRALAQVLAHFHPQTRPAPGVHGTAVLGAGVQLAADVIIEPYVVIGARTRVERGAWIGAHTVIGEDCVVGEDVRCYPQVTLYSNVTLGARTIIHSGTRLGSDGFGYTFVNGRHEKVPQVGGVIIGNDVEIGANCTVDRGSVGATEIGNGVKIDNLVHVGHNVRIGDLCIIVAQVGISGSTVLGKGVTLAGQAGLPGHLHIGDGATIAAKSAPFGDVPAGEVYTGFPARPHREFLRAQGALLKLHDLLKRVRKLEQQQKSAKE
ncbi:MAG TPA: UDP-3-O-(3-hydroxymyristoyl)glucosamine N-acyltransferase [Longimicrobiales bacterium]